MRPWVVELLQPLWRTGFWVGILCFILLQEQLQKQKTKENFPDNQEEFANKSS